MNASLAADQKLVDVSGGLADMCVSAWNKGQAEAIDCRIVKAGQGANLLRTRGQFL
jgi:hypothetical protein